MTPLDGEQFHDVVEALVDAYPSEAELVMMVRYKLNQRLAAIAMGDNLRVVIFNLITWAERHGRADELVRGAIKQTPGNPALQASLWRRRRPSGWSEKRR